MANILSGLNTLSGYLKNTAAPIATKAGQAVNAVKSVPNKIGASLQNLPTLSQASYNTGKALGRGVSTLPSATGFLRGYIPIAALGQAALDYGTYRGSQMDSDPAVKQQMTDIQNAVSNGWVPMDDGTFLNLATNELSTYDQLKNSLPQAETLKAKDIPVPQVKLENGQLTLDSNATSNLGITTSEDIPTTSEPKATVSTPQARTPSVSRVSYSTGSSGSKKKKTEDKPQVDNSISSFNALIPLLALGGLGYFMTRR